MSLRTRPTDRSRTWIWRRIVYPLFPYVRDGLLALRLIRHEGRQPWHVGWLDPSKEIDAFLAHLRQLDFQNHFVAWMDTGQVLSVRRRDGFDFQYHLRIFADGEVRAHYEKTPEADPIQHFTEAVFEPRREEFLAWLDGWITAQPPEPAVALPSLTSLLLAGGSTRSHSMPATSRGVPEKG